MTRPTNKYTVVSLGAFVIINKQKKKQPFYNKAVNNINLLQFDLKSGVCVHVADF